jgi:cutinase
MIKLMSPVRTIQKVALLGVIALALYAPAKDLIQYVEMQFARENIQIVDASFGTNMPWQESNSAYLKVSQNAQASLSRSQIIYTKLRLTNPTSKPQTYRKIWLNFSHDNGDQEYTTDYTLYNTETRQRLIGHSIQLGPDSTIDVVAAYRFIPSYKNKSPISMSVSWEGQNLLRENACQYNLETAAGNTFQYQCGD